MRFWIAFDTGASVPLLVPAGSLAEDPALLMSCLRIVTHLVTHLPTPAGSLSGDPAKTSKIAFEGASVPLLHFWNTCNIMEHADYQVFHF